MPKFWYVVIAEIGFTVPDVFAAWQAERPRAGEAGQAGVGNNRLPGFVPTRFFGPFVAA